MNTASAQVGTEIGYSFENFRQSRMTRAVTAIVLFYISCSILFPTGIMTELWRVAQMGFSFIVVVAYWRAAWSCFFYVGRWPPEWNIIALGIVLSWLSIFANGAWALLYRLAGQPAWMINNDFYTAWVALNCIAAGLHVFAPNLLGPDVPRIDKAKLTGAFAVCVVLGVFVTLVRPDLSGIALWLEGYMSEPDWLKRGLIPTLIWPRLSSLF